MTAIPRAEFRVFGHGIISIVEARMWNGRTVLQQMRALPPETYVLSTSSARANVKVRAGVLDVKTRAGDTVEGYQIFKPAAKFQFPLTADQLASVAGFLRVTALTPRAARMSEDEFLRQAAGHPDLRLVTVAKERFGFTIGDVICEYARVYVNGALLESACVESDRPELMTEVIAGLGLAAFENTNYIDMASRVIGLRATGGVR
jgi:hypothetical protein